MEGVLGWIVIGLIWLWRSTKANDGEQAVIGCNHRCDNCRGKGWIWDNNAGFFMADCGGRMSGDLVDCPYCGAHGWF
jgi:hypothetical protein